MQARGLRGLVTEVEVFQEFNRLPKLVDKAQVFQESCRLLRLVDWRWVQVSLPRLFCQRRLPPTKMVWL